MRIQLEIEDKCLLNKSQYLKMKRLFKDVEPVIQTNHYFVPEDGISKVGVRIREVNHVFEMTFKLKQKEGRLEINFPVDTCSESEFQRDDVQAFLQEQGLAKKWIYAGELITHRLVLDYPEAEVCLDRSSYLGTIDYELEVEAKAGKEKEAHARFLILCDVFRLKSTPSKGKYGRFLDFKNRQGGAR